ncbi:acyl-CoA desaturase [Massilia sp. IC2-476]|uniref:acyl-CoA desaturase n=1 Tax=Massilia sp. IC2-476 TaxID=2887199 RepID=UPI001D1160B7|nr:acyl-CoA desaturase [Massilia sp. IC2-476]MCC2973238.1 acyl-CoA desaturase [Massilia sp. IC2-476]
MADRQAAGGNVFAGRVRWEPVRSLWWTGMTGVAIVGGALTFSWTALAVFLATTATVLLFGHSLGSHRKLIHDSFACPRWLEYLLVYLGVQVGLSGPLGLVRQHDLRDHAQRQPDCHPFLRHGASFWQDAWWQLHCRLELDDPPQLEPAPGIAADRFYRFLERSWMLQQVPPALLLYLAGGWAFVIWGGCARIAAGVTGHWLIGHFAHNHGAMHHSVDGAAVQGRNVRLASLLTMGESWHNNHHAFPGSARLGLYPGEWDPGWWVLVLLRRLGLVWRIRLPHGCPDRPELRRLDDVPCAAAPVPQSLADMVRNSVAVAAALFTQAAPVSLDGPCATMSVSCMRRLAGPRAVVTRNPAQPRLRLRLGFASVVGLPAFLLAIGSRNACSAVVAVLLLPAALLAESLRGQLAWSE